ncbi:hypothetical protein I4F81_001478 [Pyropia yezoensis]|uniref:Uncharacterized protein n=1 Tax=Pyropia yezoensis TaxID=2788 RepID=A0ACC3BLU2_PYRYE|nr:hypothetical protein I4F81_001478 [Neopyropia yezoensis]
MAPPADAAFLDLLVDTARQRLRAPPPDVALPSNLESTVTDITSTLRKVLDGVREATSFLIVGPPGGGKALVLTRVLAALATPTLALPTSPPVPQVAVRYLRRAAATGPLLAAACRTVGSVGISASHLEPAIFAAEVRREWSGGDPIGPPGEAAAPDWFPATDGLTRLRVASLPPAEAGLLVVAYKLARAAAIAAAAADGMPTDADADAPGGPVSRSAVLRTYHRLYEQGGGGRGGGMLLEEGGRRGTRLGAEAVDAALQRLIDAEILVEVAAEGHVGGAAGEEQKDELGEEGEDGHALALAVDPAVVDAELRRHEGVPTVIAKWGSSWLE